MRTVFFAVMTAGLAVVGYQLIKIDPMPVQLAGGGGGGGAFSQSEHVSRTVVSADAPRLSATPAMDASVAVEPEQQTVGASSLWSWLNAEVSPPKSEAVSVRVSSAPLAKSEAGALSSDVMRLSVERSTAQRAGAGARGQAAAARPRPVTSAIDDEGLPAVVRINGEAMNQAFAVPLPERRVRIAGLSNDSATDRKTLGRGERPTGFALAALDAASSEPVGRDTRAAVVLSEREMVPPLPVWSGRVPVQTAALSAMASRREANRLGVAGDTPRANKRSAQSGKSVRRAASRKSRVASRRGKSKRPLFKYRRHCNASGCQRVLYARKPRNKAEARQIRKVRNRIVAAKIRNRRMSLGY